MAYSIDYRKRAVEYYHEGNTQAEVKAVFKIVPSTLRDWEARLKIISETKNKYPSIKGVVGNTGFCGTFKKTTEAFGLTAKIIQRINVSVSMTFTMLCMDTVTATTHTPPQHEYNYSLDLLSDLPLFCKPHHMIAVRLNTSPKLYTPRR